ncbi:MAG TPA: hypothetical protein VL360_02515 [Gammaproteobacteria bacterium]|jgi:hypothetical protein|nr:hypothetical protein [Gammaproteobacteria bacterium]
MPHTKDYYDFNCGNDLKLVKVSVQNDNFHTITVHASVAITIDFSGGTRRVETIRLQKCHKAVHIIWPERTGYIRRLYIHHADILTKLDISELTSLEELSIMNCRSLEEIVGISDTLKEINIHGANINKLDLSKAVELQKINIATRDDHIRLDLSNHENLQTAYIITHRHAINDNNTSSLNFTDCGNLHTIYLDTGANPVDIDVSGCHNLHEFAAACGKGSHESGLHDSKKMTFYIASKELELDPKSKTVTDKVKKQHAETHAYKHPGSKLKSYQHSSQEFYPLTQHSKAGIHDRETNIEQSGSIIEVDRGRGAKITLLAAPIDIQKLSLTNEFYRLVRKFMTDNQYFEPGLISSLYYLPELPDSKVPESSTHGIRILGKQNQSRLLAEWISNAEKYSPNILFIPQDSITSPIVTNFLKSVIKKPNETTINNEAYRLNPYDKIILTGEWYYLTNYLPGLASLATVIPLAAFAAGAAGPMFARSNQSEYQNALLETSKLLNERAMRSDNTLSRRLQVMQVVKEDKQLKKLTSEFFHELSRYESSENPLYAPEETPESQRGSIIKNGDDSPQHEIYGRSHLPPEQSSIDADKDYDIPPSMRGKKALQEPLNTPPQDMHGKIALQYPLNTPPQDMRGKKALQRPIDTPPNLFSRNAKQIPIRISAAQKGLDEIPPLTPNPHEQQFIFNAKRLADEVLPLQNIPQLNPDESPQKLLSVARNLANAVAVMLDNVEGIPEQILIDTESRNHDTHSNLSNLYDEAYKLAKSVEKMTRNIGALPEQILIDKTSISDDEPEDMQPKVALQVPIDISHSNTNQESAPELKAVDSRQKILAVAKQLADNVANMLKEAEGAPEQILIEVEKNHIESSRQTSHPDAINQQFYIEADAVWHESNALLNAASALADAMKKMADSTLAIETKSPPHSAVAASTLINTSINQLKHNTSSSSLVDSARGLIFAMKLLNNAVKVELNLGAEENLKLNDDVRVNMIMLLENANRLYTKDHDLKNTNTNLFGRIPGKPEMCSAILLKFIHALKKSETLTADSVNNDCTKLMHDRDLKYVIGGIETELKKYLTGKSHLKKRIKPAAKDEK